MQNQVQTSDDYWDGIKEIFGLPDNCKKAVITLEPGQAAIAECTLFVRSRPGETIIKQYYLKEINNEQK